MKIKCIGGEKMGNKTGLITPFIMLLAGSLAAIIMYIKEYEFTRMLWILLVVLIIFYIIGDIVRYLYASVRPTVVPDVDIKEAVVVAKARAEGFLAEDGTIIEHDEDAVEFKDSELDEASESSDMTDDFSEETSGEDFYNEGSQDFGDNTSESEGYEDFGEGYSDEDIV